MMRWFDADAANFGRKSSYGVSSAARSVRAIHHATSRYLSARHLIPDQRPTDADPIAGALRATGQRPITQTRCIQNVCGRCGSCTGASGRPSHSQSERDRICRWYVALPRAYAPVAIRDRFHTLQSTQGLVSRSDSHVGRGDTPRGCLPPRAPTAVAHAKMLSPRPAEVQNPFLPVPCRRLGAYQRPGGARAGAGRLQGRGRCAGCPLQPYALI